MIKEYNKLVRSNVPKLIEFRGGKPKFKIIEDKAELIKLLNQKLDEEIAEYEEAIKLQDILEELGDIENVVEALKNIHMKYIEDKEDHSFYLEGKDAVYGTYEKGVFLESVDEADAKVDYK